MLQRNKFTLGGGRKMDVVKNSESVEQSLLKMNGEMVALLYGILGEEIVVSKVHPSALKLPEGWNYVDCQTKEGRAKYGLSHSKLFFLRPNGDIWPGLAFFN